MAIDSISAIRPGLQAGGSTAAAATSSTEELGDQFLTLLVAQMRNQDPLNPADGAQITSQIAQINAVSGINQLNETLAAITGQIETTQRLQASALIGKQVLVPGSQIKVGVDGAATAFGVDLGEAAARLTITITDNTGAVVYKTHYSDQVAGVQSFAWDGLDASGAQVSAGRYQVAIAAEDRDGNAIAAQPLATGYVGGVVTTGAEPLLDLGPDGLAGLADIYQIL